MESERPTKNKNDRKRSTSRQNQPDFYLTKRWTEWDKESLYTRLIFVQFVYFVDKSSAWLGRGGVLFCPIGKKPVKVR